VTERPELLPVIGAAAGDPAAHLARCHIDPQVRERIWNDEIAPSL